MVLEVKKICNNYKFCYYYKKSYLDIITKTCLNKEIVL